MKNIFLSKKFNIKGFSILEVLIAIGVFSVGIVGISSLMLITMQAETLNAGYLKASMFAQEGIELVRVARDENWLDQGALSWDYYFGKRVPSETGYTDGTFTIDYDLNIDDTPDDISDNSTILKLNGGYYEHATGDPTNYRRLITISACTPDIPECWEVNSTVNWGGSTKNYTYSAESKLFDWR